MPLIIRANSLRITEHGIARTRYSFINSPFNRTYQINSSILFYITLIIDSLRKPFDHIVVLFIIMNDI